MKVKKECPNNLEGLQGQVINQGDLYSSKGSEKKGDKQVITIPSNSSVDQTPTLPIWGIPHLEYFIDHITEVYNCPRDYVTMSVMVAVSTAIGANATSYSGKYKNNPVLWGMLVGNQAVNKSEPLRRAFQPLMDIDAELTDSYLQKKANLKEGDKIEPLVHNILQDTTQEYRDSILSKNKRGICYFRDEMASKFAELNRYNNSSEIETELTIFSQGQTTVNRKSADPILIRNPFMSQIGTIQPDVAAKYMGSELFMTNGYLSRWLFVFPDAFDCAYYNDKEADNAILKRYDDFIRYIYNDTLVSGYTVTYSKEAKILYENYYNSLQDKKMLASDSYEAGIYGKLQIHIQRWALATYTARVFELNEGMEITAEIMQYSIDCMKYFEYTAKKIRDLVLNNRNTVTRNKSLTNENVLQELVKRYPKAGNNKQALADLIGVSRPQVSRALNRTSMLRCYGYDSENTDTEASETSNVAV